MKNQRRRRAKEIREIRRRWMRMILEGGSFQSRVRDLSWLRAHNAGDFYQGVDVVHV